MDKRKLGLIVQCLILIVIGAAGFMVIAVAAATIIILGGNAAPVDYFGPLDHVDEVPELIYSIIHSENPRRCHDAYRLNGVLFLKLCDLLR